MFASIFSSVAFQRIIQSTVGYIAAIFILGGLNTVATEYRIKPAQDVLAVAQSAVVEQRTLLIAQGSTVSVSGSVVTNGNAIPVSGTIVSGTAE